MATTPVKEEHLHLTPSQIDQLLEELHHFHTEYGALDTLLDEQGERHLLAGFRTFLESFLEESAGEMDAVRALARGYFDRNIPFVLLMGGFNQVKEHLIHLAASNMENPLDHYLEINHIFERAKRETAHHYLMMEASRPHPLPEHIVRSKLLIRLYLEWLDQVRAGIVEDLERFPLEPVSESHFSRALHYPESLLICLDLRICDQIHEQHRLIFQQASILYTMLTGERYDQAYIIYQELIKKVSELLNLLSTLYFEGETNRIHRFFNFLQAALYLPGRKFLCVLNLRQLARINRLYGNESGDRALNRVEQSLREEFEDHQSWLLFTRGIAGDFYLIGYDTTPDQLEALLERVHAKLEEQGRGELPFDIQILSHGIELSNLNELTTENMHLLVQYLTERSRNRNQRVETGEEQTRAMFEWLRNEYRRSLDLRNKLTPETTDIFVQPLVALDKTRSIHAFEVLGRFREGDGHISAGLFIDDIILMGLAPEFDTLVLEQVVAQSESLARITSRLFVNVSPASLEKREYIDKLIQAVQGPLRGFEVVLELTERVLLERIGLISELHRDHGLHFAIDDFGTGYSTLQTVIELALEGSIRYLKLDGSLTRNITTSLASERIMHITQQMARELNLETVVEVIETVAQVDKLRELDMDIGQGYLLGIPDTVAVWKGKLNYLESRISGTAPSTFIL